MAHWLGWRCGIGLVAAREHVRLAHALAELPKTAACFAEGRSSFSKVRALTRVATAETEGFFLNVAHSFSTWRTTAQRATWSGLCATHARVWRWMIQIACRRC